MRDLLEPPKGGPVATAVRLNAAFKKGTLQTSVLRKNHEPIVDLVEKLYFGRLPWKVRFFALIHGRLPFSYPEDSDDS